MRTVLLPCVLFVLCVTSTAEENASLKVELTRDVDEIQKVGNGFAKFTATAKFNGVESQDAIVSIKIVRHPSGTLEDESPYTNGTSSLSLFMDAPSVDTYRISAIAKLNGMEATAPELSLTIYRLTVDVKTLTLNQGQVSQQISAKLEPKLGGETGTFTDSNSLISKFNPSSLYLAEAEGSVFTMTAGATAGKTTVTITMDQAPFATAEIEVTINEDFPTVVLAANGDTNCGAGVVGVSIKKTLNEHQPKAFAIVENWKEKYKDKITLQLVGPISGSPVIDYSPSKLSSAQTDLTIKDGQNCRPGFIHMQAYYEGRAVSDLLKILAWEDDGNAWVEGRPFSGGVIDMPKPAAEANQSESYKLNFASQRADGDCTDSNWTFEWNASPFNGFTFDPVVETGVNRSTSVATIDDNVSAGFYTAKVVSYRTSSLVKGRKEFRQSFTFHEATLTTGLSPVLAGGNDNLQDSLHGADIAFDIGGNLHLDRMQIDTNSSYGVKIKPTIDKTPDPKIWHFGSSDLVPSMSTSKSFTVSSHVDIPMIGGTVRVGKVTIEQEAGDFEGKITKPADNQIYPNGAVEFVVKYSFRNAIAPHPVRGEMSEKDIQPIEPPPGGTMLASNSVKEFEYVGEAKGLGTFTSQINKQKPLHDDITNSIYHYFLTNLYDDRIFSEDQNNGTVMTDPSFNVLGGDRSFWRKIPGEGSTGSFWNWATIIKDVPGGSFKVGAQSIEPTGTFGVSETWKGDDFKKDENSTIFKETLPNEMSASLANLDLFEARWKNQALVMNDSIARYELFIKGMDDALFIGDLIGRIKDLTQTLKNLKKALETLKQKPPKPSVLLKIAELEETIREIGTQIGETIASFNEKINELSGLLNPDTPFKLLRDADAFKNELLKLRGELQRAKNDEVKNAKKFFEYVIELNDAVQENAQLSKDPDESLKRKLLEARLQVMADSANTYLTKIAQIEAEIGQLKALIVQLESAVDLAAKTAGVKALTKFVVERLSSFLEAIPLDEEVEELLELLKLREKAILWLKNYLDQDAGKEYDNVKALIVEANTKVSKVHSNMRDAFKECQDKSKSFEFLYNVWITPTLENPERILKTITPKLKLK